MLTNRYYFQQEVIWSQRTVQSVSKTIQSQGYHNLTMLRTCRMHILPSRPISFRFCHCNKHQFDSFNGQNWFEHYQEAKLQSGNHYTSTTECNEVVSWLHMDGKIREDTGLSVIWHWPCTVLPTLIIPCHAWFFWGQSSNVKIFHTASTDQAKFH